MSKRTFKIWRGEGELGQLTDYSIDIDKGMVILDVIHKVQAEHAGDLAARWNCKAGKCGSCSVEINGRPKLGCMTRLNEYEEKELSKKNLHSNIDQFLNELSINYSNLKL